MDFAPSPDERAIQETFRRFALHEVMPVAQDLDENPRFPRELFRRAGELGLFGMRYPEPEGNGAGIVAHVLAMEEIARASLSVAAACAMQSLMGTHFVHRFAEGTTRQRLLPGALAGEVVGAICLSEPGAGSDLGGITTTADKHAEGFIVTGRKTWVTSAPVADMFTVLARTGQDTMGIFLIERGARGLTIDRDIEKSGVRASLTSEVSFESTPVTAVLGDPAKGAAYLKEILAAIRVMTAALAVGIAQAALDEAVGFAATRHQFGKPINRFQAVQEHLAEMATDVEAARRMTHWAAWRSAEGMSNDAEASMAKLFASEAAMRTCDRAARVLASHGYHSGSPVERYLRDVRFTLIGGGTSEILRGHVARALTP